MGPPKAPANSIQGRDTSTTGLVRELGLLDATAIVVGTIIGSGIFLVPGAVAGELGALSIVLLAWLVGGLLSLFGSLSLAEMGAAFPAPGGLYVYLGRAYGPAAAFLYGWALLAVIHSGSIATLAVAFSLYLARLLPLGDAQKVAGIAAILLLTLVNYWGLRAGKLVQNLFTAAKLGGLTVMTLLLLIGGQPLRLLRGGFWPDNLGQVEWSQFGLALIAVLWAYEGWHVVSFAAGEIRRPARNLPRSLAYGMFIITASYLLANCAYYTALSRPEIQGSDTVAVAAMSRVFGPATTGFVSLLILVSIFGAMNGMVLTGPRVYYAMAREGLFFRRFTRISPRYHSPAFAIVVQGFWACLLTMVGSFRELFTYVVFTAWIFYGLAVAGVIVLRRRQPGLERPYRVPAFPWLPAAFCVAAVGIILSTVMEDPARALGGIALILVGVPLYLLFRRRAGPAVSPPPTGEPREDRR